MNNSFASTVVNLVTLATIAVLFYFGWAVMTSAGISLYDVLQYIPIR